MSKRTTPPPAVIAGARKLLLWTARDMARGLNRLTYESARYYYRRPAELLGALVWFFEACAPETGPRRRNRHVLKNPTRIVERKAFLERLTAKRRRPRKERP